jgi:hypothetical protein
LQSSLIHVKSLAISGGGPVEVAGEAGGAAGADEAAEVDEAAGAIYNNNNHQIKQIIIG